MNTDSHRYQIPHPCESVFIRGSQSFGRQQNLLIEQRFPTLQKHSPRKIAKNAQNRVRRSLCSLRSFAVNSIQEKDWVVASGHAVLRGSWPMG